MAQENVLQMVHTIPTVDKSHTNDGVTQRKISASVTGKENPVFQGDNATQRGTTTSRDALAGDKATQRGTTTSRDALAGDNATQRSTTTSRDALAGDNATYRGTTTSQDTLAGELKLFFILIY